MAGTKTATKDLQTKTTSVKGGRLIGNDNVTLLRAAKPSKKDLPTSKDVKGGAGSNGKLATNDNLTLVRAAKPTKKDLPASKDVKGGVGAKGSGNGKLAVNDNLTLVRG